MMPKCCGDVIINTANNKEFYYCRGCKTEVEDKPLPTPWIPAQGNPHYPFFTHNWAAANGTGGNSKCPGCNLSYVDAMLRLCANRPVPACTEKFSFIQSHDWRNQDGTCRTCNQDYPTIHKAQKWCPLDII